MEMCARYGMDDLLGQAEHSISAYRDVLRDREVLSVGAEESHTCQHQKALGLTLNPLQQARQFALAAHLVVEGNCQQPWP